MGQQEADCRFQKLLACLSHPPSYTCVRASTHLVALEEIRRQLGEELKKVSVCCFYRCVGARQQQQWKSYSVCVLLKAADVQLITRGPSDSSTPTNYRCAAASCRRAEVCEECWNSGRQIWTLSISTTAELEFPGAKSQKTICFIQANEGVVLLWFSFWASDAEHGQKQQILADIKEKKWVVWKCVTPSVLWSQAGAAAQLRGGGGSSVWECRTERRSRLRTGHPRQPQA